MDREAIVKEVQVQISPAVIGEVISGRGHDNMEEVAESAEGERCLANLDEQVVELDKDVGIVDLGVDADRKSVV